MSDTVERMGRVLADVLMEVMSERDAAREEHCSARRRVDFLERELRSRLPPGWSEVNAANKANAEALDEATAPGTIGAVRQVRSLQDGNKKLQAKVAKLENTLDGIRQIVELAGVGLASEDLVQSVRMIQKHRTDWKKHVDACCIEADAYSHSQGLLDAIKRIKGERDDLKRHAEILEASYLDVERKRDNALEELRIANACLAGRYRKRLPPVAEVDAFNEEQERISRLNDKVAKEMVDPAESVDTGE